MIRHGSSPLSAKAIAPWAMTPRGLPTIIHAEDATQGRPPRQNDRSVAPKSGPLAPILTVNAAGRASTRTDEKSKSP
jgi:hypothetical protein